MEILYGLGAALGWGSADFMAGQISRQIGSFRALFFAQFIGFFALGIYALATGMFAQLSLIPLLIIGAAILAAVLNMISSLSLYRAFEVGLMAVVSPITASYGALTAVFAFLSGERMPVERVIGVIAAVVGVLLTASVFNVFNPNTIHQKSFSRGVGWAILAAVGYGVTFWLFGFFVTPIMGGIVPVFINRATTLVILSAMSLITRQSLALPRKHEIARLFLIGGLDTAAFVAILTGSSIPGAVSVVTVLSSLYTTVTVVLASYLLHERLHISQWIGVGLIILGIVLCSV